MRSGNWRVIRTVDRSLRSAGVRKNPDSRQSAFQNEQHCGPASRFVPHAEKEKKPAFAGGFRVSRAYRDGAQKRVRMPIVPTIWFGVLDAPPAPLMNAW